MDIDAIVLGEHAENELRKDFTVSERVAIGGAVEVSLGERRGRPKENVQNLAQLPAGEKTRDIAAEKSGFGNAKSYRQAKAIVEKGTPELIEAVDRGYVSISAAAELSRLPRPEQCEIVAAGPKAVIEAARAFRTVWGGAFLIIWQQRVVHPGQICRVGAEGPRLDRSRSSFASNCATNRAGRAIFH